MFTVKHNRWLTALVIMSVQVLILLGAMIGGASPKVSAAYREQCPDGYEVTFNQPSEYGEKCANHQNGTQQNDVTEAEAATTGNFKGDCTGKDASGKEVGLNKDSCGIVAYIVDFIKILSGVVGIVSVIMIAVWGIQYTVARDNPQMVAQARTRLVQTVLALVAYLFVYAFLQWVVPGGVF